MLRFVKLSLGVWSSNSLLVVVLVGTVLNGINQGVTLLTGRRIAWFEVALTFLAPFFVATYGAYNAYRWAER